MLRVFRAYPGLHNKKEMCSHTNSNEFRFVAPEAKLFRFEQKQAHTIQTNSQNKKKQQQMFHYGREGWAHDTRNIKNYVSG